MVRLRNQIGFSLFDKGYAKAVVIGKENYFFEKGYINAYYGTDYIGQDSINHRVGLIKEVQDTLASLGKDLIIVLAPGKGAYFPEYIPDRFHREKGPTNYQGYAEKFKEAGVNHIDFMKWFLERKDTAKYPLYPRTGVHWSDYSMVRVADSLIHYIEALRGIDLPDYVLKEVRVRDELSISDKDIERGLNLMYKIPNHEMAYIYAVFENEDKEKPRIMVVADSYFWGIYTRSVISRVFDQGEFWYYNRQVYPKREESSSMVKDLDLREEINNKDIIVILSTDGNLPRFPFGWIKSAHSLYYNTLDSLDTESAEVLPRR